MSVAPAAFDPADVATLAADVAAGRRSGEELVRRSLERLDRLDHELHAFLSRDPSAGARTSHEMRAGGHAPRPLEGIPVAVKDNLCTAELPTTCGSRILVGYRSPYEATVVAALRAAGGVVVGKTNLDEFAMGSSTENSGFGPTRNPWDPSRVPGGSSGGSAAAVAAGIVPVALGSDTGGSVRQPAAFCGVVGIKPTYGRVSRYGLVAFASSLDQVGTLGFRVADAARLLEAIAGPDDRDSTAAARRPPSFDEALRRGARKVVVGVPREYFPDGLDPRVREACRHALDALRAEGAEVVDVSLPHTPWAIPTYYIIAPAEASSNLARYDGARYGRRAPGAETVADVYEESRRLGFGPEVKRRIMLGTFVLSAGYHDRYYGRAQRVRRLIARDFRRVFDGRVDVLFTPTTPGPAFPLGERTEDPYAMYLADTFTVPANLAGLPALSLPVARSDGLPIGGQLMAPPWEEETLVAVASALERRLSAEGVWRTPS